MPTQAATDAPLKLRVASGVFSPARASVTHRPSAAIAALPIIRRIRFCSVFDFVPGRNPRGGATLRFTPPLAAAAGGPRRVQHGNASAAVVLFVGAQFSGYR